MKINKIVNCILVFIVLFIVTNEIVFIIKGTEPSTLEMCVLGTGVMELLYTMILQRDKKKREMQQHDEEEVDFYDIGD